MNKWIWIGVGGLCLLVLGFILGAVIHPGFKEGGTVVTNYIKGTNTVQYIYEYKDATNNIAEIYNAYLHFSKDNFQFIQLNDSMNVTLFTRSASVKIKQWQNQDGVIIGGGWNIFNSAPAVLGGWHWKNLGVIGTANISTNIALTVFGIWIF